MQVATQVSIDRPVAEVFAYMANLNNYTQWATGAPDLRPDAQDLGTFVVLRQVSGRRTRAHFRVVELIPSRRLVLQGESDGMPWTSTVTFDEAGMGARVSEVMEVQLGGLVRWVTPLITRIIARTQRADLLGLKRQLETAA